MLPGCAKFRGFSRFHPVVRVSLYVSPRMCPVAEHKSVGTKLAKWRAGNREWGSMSGKMERDNGK